MFRWLLNKMGLSGSSAIGAPGLAEAPSRRTTPRNSQARVAPGKKAVTVAPVAPVAEPVSSKRAAVVRTAGSSKRVAAPRIVGPKRAPLRKAAVLVRRAQIVERAQTPYWQERGWIDTGHGIHKGSYQTEFGSWQGEITLSPAGRVDVYILNPPIVLENHRHWPCFRKRDKGWYFVHPIDHFPEISAAILTVEKTINEAYNAN